ncbi:MAG: hypothetical protein V4439_02405 [Patescibacteria group bacterium]
MKNKISNSLSICIVVAVVVLFSYFFIHKSKKEEMAMNQVASLAGMQTGYFPWKAEREHLRERLDSIGLPALSEEGVALHIHQHLDIFIDGKSVSIPEYIGIDAMEKFISIIHTHDTSGMIHVESPKVDKFTLGQFFDIWGVSLTQNSIGGYANQNDKMLKVFVNGKEITTDPRELALEAHQEIVITYGTEKEIPNPIPSKYDFPEGE